MRDIRLPMAALAVLLAGTAAIPANAQDWKNEGGTGGTGGAAGHAAESPADTWSGASRGYGAPAPAESAAPEPMNAPPAASSDRAGSSEVPPPPPEEQDPDRKQ